MSILLAIITFAIGYRKFILGVIRYKIYSMVVDETTKTVTYGYRGEIYKFMIPPFSIQRARRMLTSVTEITENGPIDITSTVESYYGPDHNWHGRLSLPKSSYELVIKYSDNTQELIEI